LGTDTADTGFLPIARFDAQILILGSLPGQRSLQEQQYYAHPQNAFWKIMCELVGARGSYAQRCAALLENRIALWDVLAQSVRPGSMDAKIRLDCSLANNFEEFYADHLEIRRIGFNGHKAAELYARLAAGCPNAEQIVLPSTSPAYAAMPFADKLNIWRRFIG
jgi:TDG/mug DNA glycosylase family protein